MNNTKLKSIASEVLKLEGQELLDAAERIAESVVKASDIISNHSGKVVLCGMGKSGLIAQKIAATLCSIGNKAVFLHAAEAVHGDLGIYAPGDPTILISKSGATEEMLRLIPILKEFNSPLIGILGNMKSPLVRKMDVVLDASVKKEADPLGIVPTSSTTLTLAIGDAIVGVLMSQREFKQDDFARLHPAGDLGRKLPPAERQAIEILNGKSNMGKQQLRVLYKGLIKDLHPDMNGGNRSDEDQLQKVVWAWDQIKDSRRFSD